MDNTLVSVPVQRPSDINDILNSLKRYDVSVIKDLEDYLKVQCEQNFSDVNANLALLKLYELSSESLNDEREEATINILLLGLCNFYNIDFELYLHLLPVYVLADVTKFKDLSSEDSSIIQFCSYVNKLKELYVLLTSAKFTKFWSLLKTDDSYQDLVYDSYLADSFDSNIRNLIFNVVYKGYSNNNSQIKSKISSQLLQSYLNLNEADFGKFIESKKFFKINGDHVLINHDAHLIKNDDEEEQKHVSTNAHNSIISSENIKFEQLSRLIKESLEK
ncbi:hypothetical protein DASC09_000900 [Saccharomycopsis crataegensis]|uniref:PCI domain-containing protein n=1 Tax=Saccharomycopsis crataegensis TaxID=43959 RepID=A0AAV5QEC5_9ASCO|nr:hypothetical protein DASC09_000900 [Saccharomycopsis crataegensis]